MRQSQNGFVWCGTTIGYCWVKAINIMAWFDFLSYFTSASDGSASDGRCGQMLSSLMRRRRRVLRRDRCGKCGVAMHLYTFFCEAYETFSAKHMKPFLQSIWNLFCKAFLNLFCNAFIIKNCEAYQTYFAKHIKPFFAKHMKPFL